MSITTSTRRRTGPATLGSERRVTLLAALQENGASTVGELADLADVHENTVRDHLSILVAAGLVSRERGTPNGRGRPRIQYRAAIGRELRADPAASTRLERSIDEAKRIQSALSDDPCAPPACSEQGVLTGSSAGDRQVLALFGHLDEMGLEPTLDPEELALDLWHCPHQVPIGAAPAPACRVHLALARSVLDQIDGPVRAADLLPHVGPDRCTLALTCAQG